MATGTPFPQANRILRGPPGTDVYDLHVHAYRDKADAPHLISRWQLSAKEFAELIDSGGVLWFRCWGETHPPLSIETADPFCALPPVRGEDAVAEDEIRQMFSDHLTFGTARPGRAFRTALARIVDPAAFDAGVRMTPELRAEEQATAYRKADAAIELIKITAGDGTGTGGAR